MSREAFEDYQRSIGKDAPASMNGNYCEEPYQVDWLLWQASETRYAMALECAMDVLEDIVKCDHTGASLAAGYAIEEIKAIIGVAE